MVAVAVPRASKHILAYVSTALMRNQIQIPDVTQNNLCSHLIPRSWTIDLRQMSEKRNGTAYIPTAKDRNSAGARTGSVYEKDSTQALYVSRIDTEHLPP